METSESLEANGSPGVVYRGIVDGLYRGRYVPGQRLVEADLTRDFDVGRGSVREALNRLAAEGLVSMNLHRSAVVRALTRKEAGDVARLLETLNGLAARLAAEAVEAGASHSALDEAFTAVASQEARGDFVAFARARNVFYKTIVAMGGNGELARIMPRTNGDLLRVQFRPHHPHTHDDERVELYRAIYAGICEGSPRRAEAAAKAHIRRFAERVDTLPEAAFAPDRE